MMWGSGSWVWAWFMMLPMTVLTWALVAWLVIPLTHKGRAQTSPAVERLDQRFAAGEIGVDEYRSRRSELP